VRRPDRGGREASATFATAPPFHCRFSNQTLASAQARFPRQVSRAARLRPPQAPPPPAPSPTRGGGTSGTPPPSRASPCPIHEFEGSEILCSVTLGFVSSLPRAPVRPEPMEIRAPPTGLRLVTPPSSASFRPAALRTSFVTGRGAFLELVSCFPLFPMLCRRDCGDVVVAVDLVKLASAPL
jgi:hypothetical protein